MTDLLAEIDEQMRIEKMQKFWHDHKQRIVGAIVAVIVLVAGNAAYQSHVLKQNEQSTLAMYALSEAETFPNNITAETDLSGINDGEQTLLLLNAAKAYHDADETDTALALYRRVINDIDAPEPFDAIARILYARLAPVDGTEETLTVLDAVSDDHTYYALALIEKALIHGRRDDYEQALAMLDVITALPALPNTIYLKAQSVRHVYAMRLKSPENAQNETAE